MTASLLALSGSTREGAFNQRLVDIAIDRARAAGAEVTAVSLRDYSLPLYDADVERDGFPDTARRLKRLFLAHDGFLISTPEHNGSVSAVLKNVLDWVSRPTEDESMVALTAFRGKAAGIMSASISPFGGLRGLTHLRQILGVMHTLVATQQVLIPFAQNAFEGPTLKDPMPLQLMDGLVRGVIALAIAHRASGRD